jgi:hypothetical protein
LFGPLPSKCLTSSLIIDIEKMRGRRLPNFTRDDKCTLPSSMIQNNLVDCRRYNKSIPDKTFMMGFIPDKPKIITSNSNKSLKQVNLSLKDTKQIMRIEYNKESISHM